MKRLTISVLFLAALSICNAQMFESARVRDPRMHRGFYLSMGLGANFSTVSDLVVGSYNYKFKGVGVQFDGKVGGAIRENLILHGSLLVNSMSGPEVSSGGQSQNTTSSLTLTEILIGGGATYYFMPYNIFLSGTFGMGEFGLTDDDSNTSVTTDMGFSMQLKAGKEWWISKRWGIGAAITYGKTKLTNDAGSSGKEDMDSNNFGILFNATFN
jgi:hypothetical protein